MSKNITVTDDELDLILECVNHVAEIRSNAIEEIDEELEALYDLQDKIWDIKFDD